MAFFLCLVFGIYLLGSVWQAARTQRLYRDLDPLLTAQIQLHVERGMHQEAPAGKTTSLGLTSDLFGDPVPPLGNKRFGNRQQIDDYLQTLTLVSQLFERAQEDGALLKLFGLPLNEKAVGVMMGFLASTASTGIGQLLP